MDSWYVRLSWNGPTNENVIETITSALTGHAPVGSFSPTGNGGSVLYVVIAEDFDSASRQAMERGRRAVLESIPTATFTDFSVKDEMTMDYELAQPMWPDVVGYAEIADLAGVSRQRARQFTAIDGFPKPVIVTAQGPLYRKAGIEVWLAHRNRRTGRPRAAD